MVGLKPGNLVLVKADTFSKKEEDQGQMGEKPYEVVHQITTDIPLYDVKDQHGNLHILHHNQLLLIASEADIPLHVGTHQAWDGCTNPITVNPTPEKLTARQCHKKMMVW